MAFSEFDKAMKELEWYRSESLPKGVWPILRIDGRGFSKLTQRMKFEKPYDRGFHMIMSAVTKALVENLQAAYGYHQSDEISILLPKGTDLFDRRVEKLVSVSAGLATAVFNQEMPAFAPPPGEPPILPHFDSRMVVAVNDQDALDYFKWRLQDATRNCLNSYCHWTAIQKKGLSATRAATLFNGQSVEFKNEWLFRQGINFNDVPSWQKRGSSVCWELYARQGWNPKEQKAVEVSRWKAVAGHELPMGAAHAEWMARVIERAQAPREKTIQVLDA